MPRRDTLNRTLDVAQAILVAAAVLLCTAGRGQHRDWLILAFALPALRFVLAASFRRRVLGIIQRYCSQLGEFAQAAGGRFDGAASIEPPAAAMRPAPAPSGTAPEPPVAALRPHAAAPLPLRAVLLLVVLPVAAVNLSTNISGVSGDTAGVIPTATSLVTRGSLRIDDDYVARLAAKTARSNADTTPADNKTTQQHSSLPYYLIRTPHGVYSAYPLGMVQFAVPVVAAAKLVHADLPSPHVARRLEKWTAAWLAGACAGLVLLIVLHLIPAAPALALTAMLALGSSMFSTVGQGLWQHGGVVFLSLMVLLIEVRCAGAAAAWRARRPHHPRGAADSSVRARRPYHPEQAADSSVWAGRPRFPMWIKFRAAGGRAWSELGAAPWSAAILQGIACGAALACRSTAALFVAAFLLWTLLRSPRRAALIALAAALTFAPWLLLHLSIYGHPLGPSGPQTSADLWTTPAAHLVDVLFSPGRGLLIYTPWLGLVALLPFMRGRPPLPGWSLFLLALLAAHILLVSSWGMWWGGHCYGPRLLSEIVPLAALAIAPAVAGLWRHAAGRTALAALAALSLALHLPPLYADAMRWNREPVDVDLAPQRLWSWPQAPFLTVWR